MRGERERESADSLPTGQGLCCRGKREDEKMRECVWSMQKEDQMKSIISGKKLDHHPVSTTLQHDVNILRYMSAGTLRKERMEVSAGGVWTR